MTVPYAFGSATSAIPLSQLDANFNTPITLGNTAIQLGNTVTTLNNMTLANVTITSGTINASFSNANAVVYTNASNVATTSSALTFDGTTISSPVVQSTNGTITTVLSYSGGNSTGVIGTTSNHSLEFRQNNAEQMRLTSTGLGIGTSSPTAFGSGYKSLQITGSNGANIYLTDTGGVASNAFFVWSGAGFATLGTTGAYPLTLRTNNTTQATLDSSGNLGLGVTPAAWSGLVSFSIASTGSNISSASNDNLFITSGAYYNGTNWIYKATSQAVSSYQQLSGIHRWNIAASGTAGNAITFTQAMTLDASGNLVVGSTSPDSVGSTTTITIDKASGNGQLSLAANGTVRGRIFADNGSSEFRIGNPTSNPLTLFTANTERARITSDGEVYIAGTTDQGAYNLQVNGTGVWGAGAYVNGSDRNLKDNIQSMDSCLDVVMAMRPVTFQYKPEHSKDQSVQPGFIAQELQEAMTGKAYLDGVVQAGPEYLNVAYQNIIPILVKAIQELKAEVAALKGA